MDFDMDYGGSPDQEHPYGPPASTRLGTAAWTRDTSMSVACTVDTNRAFRGSTDHGSLSRRTNSENELFSILDIFSLLKTKAVMWLGGVFRGRAYISSRLLHTTQPALLDNNMFPHPLQPSPAPVTSVISLVAPLSMEHTPLLSSIFLISPSHIVH